jgi:hypothetical protein
LHGVRLTDEEAVEVLVVAGVLGRADGPDDSGEQGLPAMTVALAGEDECAAHQSDSSVVIACPESKTVLVGER